jgi:hypothetical protein
MGPAQQTSGKNSAARKAPASFRPMFNLQKKRKSKYHETEIWDKPTHKSP